MRSRPFRFDDRSTLTTSSVAMAPRGMMTSPPTAIGSSTTAVNVMPGWEESAAIGWVVRTLTFVPAGTIDGPDAYEMDEQMASTRMLKTERERGLMTLPLLSRARSEDRLYVTPANECPRCLSCKRPPSHIMWAVRKRFT